MGLNELNEVNEVNDVTEVIDTKETSEVSGTQQKMNFEETGIDERILRSLEEMGYEQLTPIQTQAIPVLLEGKDIIGQAQTGTGKTAAFGIPLIQNIDVENRNLQAIVLCPTRELAIQAAEELRRFAKFMAGVKVLPIYGGQDISKQIRSLKGEVQIVVGTPGRVMDHMRRHTLKLDHVKAVVLDEADEMLNMGFREDIETILEQIPQKHQTALFSATMPKPIMDITKTYQTDAVLIKVVAKELTIPLVKQYYYEVKGKNKMEVVCRLLDYYDPKRTLIFSNTKRMVDELAETLKGRGYFAEGLHGDLSQNQRDLVMNRFRSGTIDILIATDVAARGIDVDDVEAVFNYDVPQDIEYYVHRIGRTGRAGRKGRSFTLVVGKEIYKIRDIEHTCKTKIKARTVPSAADINAIKAEKVMTKAFDLMKDTDLSKMIKIIEEKVNDEEDCTSIELAAALLKMHFGEEIIDIPVETYVPEKRYGRGENSGRRDSGSGRRDGGAGRRDSGSGRRDSSSGRRDASGSRDASSGSRRYEGAARGESTGRSSYNRGENATGRSSYGNRTDSTGRSVSYSNYAKNESSPRSSYFAKNESSEKKYGDKKAKDYRTSEHGEKKSRSEEYGRTGTSEHRDRKDDGVKAPGKKYFSKDSAIKKSTEAKAEKPKRERTKKVD